MNWVIHFDLAGIAKKVDALNAQTEQPEFWSDQKRAQKVLKELKMLRQKKSS